MPFDIPPSPIAIFRTTQHLSDAHNKAAHLFQKIHLYKNKSEVQELIGYKLHSGLNFLVIYDASVGLEFSSDEILLSKSISYAIYSANENITELKTYLSEIMRFQSKPSVSNNETSNQNSAESTWFDAGVYSYIKIERNNPLIIYVTCGSFDSEYVKNNQPSPRPLFKERF